MEKMQFNVNAEEWFPKNHQSHSACANTSTANVSGVSGNRYQAQNRIKQIRASGQEPTESSNQQAIAHLSNVGKQEGDVSADFQYLQGIIARLIADPGHFEEVIDIFMQTLHIHLESAEMMMQLCNFIFINAIEEASFRYNAARLCLLIQDDSPTFRANLNNFCIMELEKNRQKPGFTLFLAELHCQGHNSNWKMLYKAVTKLISLGGDENVKAACQTLKLAGHSMEAFDKHQMEDVLQDLETKKPFVQRNVSALIENVLNLRTHKWGHSSSSTELFEASSGSSGMANGFVSGDTFYGPGGEELTDAERRFLEELNEYDDPDELYNPEPEMDEEIQAAFKEFVKLGK